MENNDKKNDERYQKKLLDDKESDDRDQISKFNEEKIIEDIEVLKLKNWVHRKKGYPEKESDKINPMDISDNKDSYERDQIKKWWSKIVWCYRRIETGKIEFA